MNRQLEDCIQSLDEMLNGILKHSSPSLDLHFNICCEVHAIMTHPGYKDRGAKFSLELDEKITHVLPGMGKHTLMKMHEYFPRRSQWKSLKEVFDNTIEKMRDEKPKPPKKKPATPGPATEITTVTIDEAEGRDSVKYGMNREPGIDILGRPNEGGEKFRGRTIEKWCALEVENEMLKEENVRKDEEIARLREENRSLRVKLSALVVPV